MSVRFLMNQQSHSSTCDLVVSALEAISGSMKALEMVSAALAEEPGRQQQRRKVQVDTAIDLLRAAVSEIRQSDEGEVHPGAVGFVLAVRRRRGTPRRRLPPAE